MTITAKRQADGEFPINFPDPQYQLPPAVRKTYRTCISGGQLNDGATFQSNGDVMIGNVVFNSPAYWWIRDKKLYLSSTLQSQLPGGKQIATPMPAGSIVLKAMWWPVQKSGYTALPVWDDAQPGVENNQYAGFEIQRVWSRAVAVTPNPQPGVTSTDVTYLYHALADRGPNTYKAARIVPVQNFYTLQFPDLDVLDTCDRALLDASAYWAYNRAFDKDDYLVLIAMHIMTKEQPDWTFQSLWWHDQPAQGPYAADRPDIPASKAPGPWRNYLMTSTYGIPQTGGRQWPIAYNPYIELAAAHPIRTNCMNCHRRAAWPPRPPDGPGASDALSSNYEAPGGPDALDVFTIDNPIFNKLLMLDNMWVISDRAVRQPAPSRR